MTLSISDLNGNRFAEVKGVSVHGLPGCGCYILYLSLSISVTPLDSDVELSQLSCRIENGETNVKIANGEIENRPIVTWHKYSNDEQIGFLFYLSTSQVAAIEEARNSSDLKIGVWLSGEISQNERSSTFIDRGIFTIPKQEWLEVLSRMNYKQTLLFELPLPSDDIFDSDLKTLLERAQNHILNGHYQESVGLCRQAIEVIEKVNEDKSLGSNAVKKYKDQRADMSGTERMLFLREALKNIAHLGSHHADDFSRQQAQAILGMTVALLSCPEVGIKT